MPDHDRRRAVSERDMACAKRLQGFVRIGCLVVRICVQQRGRFVGEDFPQVGSQRPALCKPVADIGVQRLLRLGLVEGQEPRHPAIGKTELVKFGEQSRLAGCREPVDGEDFQCLFAKAWAEPAGQWRIDQERIEAHR